MSKGAGTPSPYQYVTTKQDIPKWKKELLGFTKDAPEDSPFKWLSRQAKANANMIEGMTFNPSAAAMARGYGVPEGTDLTPYIYASRTGQIAPLPASLTTPTAPATAAKGGLMSLRKRGFAAGGKTVTRAQIQQALAAGVSPSAIQQAVQSGQVKVQNTAKPAANTPSTPATTPSTTPAQDPAVPFSQAMEVKTPYYNPYDPTAAPYGGVTDPLFQKGVDYLNTIQQAPSQFGQATNLYNQAASGLAGLTNYQPQQVSAQSVSAPSASAQQASAQGYSASSMSAPEAVQAQDYVAAQMEKPEDVTSKALQYFQMQGPGSWTDPGVAEKYMNPYEQGVIDIAKRQKGVDYAKQQNELNRQAAASGAFGGSRQAMQQSQAAKDYQQQLQDLETQGLSQAYQQGMQQYGAESALGQQANIQNLQALLGTQTTESQQALQAALANQAAGLTTNQQNMAALNAQRSQYVNNALQAAMQAYGGQLTAAQQNMIAQNAASQFNAAAQNQASLTNAQLGTNVSMANAANALAASQSNATNALNASLANQQAGLQAANLGINTYGAMGNMAQGLGSIGVAQGNYQLQIPQLYGAAANTSMGAGNTWANNQYITGQNYWNANPYGAVTNLVNQQPAGTGSSVAAKTPGT